MSWKFSCILVLCRGVISCSIHAKLRGSDFLMRWSQGVWSEQQLVTAVNDTGTFLHCPMAQAGLHLPRMSGLTNYTLSDWSMPALQRLSVPICSFFVKQTRLKVDQMLPNSGDCLSCLFGVKTNRIWRV